MRPRTYLDHNATSPLRPGVARVWQEVADRAWANPSSPHAEGQMAHAELEAARSRVGHALGVAPETVVFTSGASESKALALSGCPSVFGSGVLVSAVEHPSALAWGRARAPVDSEGRVDLRAMERILKAAAGGLGVVAVMAANNETGVLQPLEEVA